MDSDYAWSDRDLDAYCLTIVVGTDEALVLDAFAVDAGSRRTATFVEQWDMSAPGGFGNDTVQIAPLGDAIVCIEANGWAGVDEARAGRLSAGGSYAASYRSVNADMLVVVARDGVVTRTFDPLLYDAAGAIPEEAGLPFGEPGRCASAVFALLERLTGVSITRAWLLETPHPCFRRDADA